MDRVSDPAEPLHRARLPHLPALDGLRGAAVVAVLAFHLGLIRGGYLGVDLFFTLSGFLITGLLVAEWRAHGRIDLRRFWVRRARRLLPAMLLVLVAVAFATRRWGSATTYASVRWDALATLAYAANWRSVLAGTDYWNLFARPSPLEHTWSLAIEEQFYLVWPLVTIVVLVWWGARSARRPEGVEGAGGAERPPPTDAEVRSRLVRYLAVCLSLAVVSMGSGLLRFRNLDDANRVYFGTDTRVGSILLGAALAIATACFGTIPAGRWRKLLEAAAVVAALGLGWAWLALRGTDPWLYRGGLIAAAIAATVLLAAASHPVRGPVSRVLAVGPLRGLGLISYGLYLWHWPVICLLTPGRLADAGLRVVGLPLVGLRAAVSLGLALLSYALVERPIRHGWGEGWMIRLATPVTVGLVVALVVWNTRGAIAPVGDRGGGRDQLRIAANPIPPDDPSRSRLLVVGDSGAWALQYALADVARTAPIDWVDRGTPACGVANGDGRSRQPDGRIIADPPGCEDWPRRWSWYVDHARPDVALLFSVAPAGAARMVEGRWRKDCDPAFDRWYQRATEEAIHVLGRGGAKVAVTTVAPMDSGADTDGRYPEVDCRNETIRRAARATGAQVVDLARWVCDDDGRCRDTVRTLAGKEVELRPDGLHYSGPGGVVTARWVLRELGLPDGRS